MVGQPIPYPKLAGSLVDSINSAVSSGELVLPVEGAPVSVVPMLAPGAYDTCLVLSFSVGGSSVRVHLNPAAVGCALGSLIDVPSFASLDDDLKLAVLEAALAVPLGPLSALLRAEIVLESIIDGSKAAGTELRLPEEGGAFSFPGLLFEIRQPPELVCCAVLVEFVSPLPESLIKCLAEYATGRNRDLGVLPVPVRFELGASSLSSVEFRSLEPGDIVLFDQCHIVEGRLRVNIGDRIFLVGELEGQRLTLHGGV